MIVALQVVVIVVLIASTILSIAANASMIDYCRERKIRLRYAFWEYYIMPGLISNEYADASRDNEGDGPGIWYPVFWSTSIGTLLLGLCFSFLSKL